MRYDGNTPSIFLENRKEVGNTEKRLTENKRTGIVKILGKNGYQKLTYLRIKEIMEGDTSGSERHKRCNGPVCCKSA